MDTRTASDAVCNSDAPDDGEAAHLLLGYAGAGNNDVQESDRENGTIVCAAASAPIDQIAAAWVRHIEGGNPGPDSPTALLLLKGMLESRIPQALTNSHPGVQLVQVDTGKKFPHMIDTMNGTLSEEDGIWTQCKTKMTHIAVRLVDLHGQPVMGTQVQEGGLELQLTVHSTGNPNEPLNDSCNPRETEGLFLGRAQKAFSPVKLLLENWCEYRFQLMLLSSDIAGSHMFVKVAPVHPSLAFKQNLTVLSRTFVSRARMPDSSSSRHVNPSSFVSNETPPPPALPSQHAMEDTADSEAQ